MAQNEYSNVYWAKIMGILEINGDPRFLEFLKKVQAALEAGNEDEAARQAKYLASLLISEAGGGRAEWGAEDVTATEIVNEITEAIRSGMEDVERDGDPEFWADLDEGLETDPRFDPNAGGVDTGLAEQLEQEQAEAEDAYHTERADNILHMAARNLDLVADSRYDNEIAHIINMAVMNSPNVIALAEALANRIADDRGMPAGAERDGFVAEMRARVGDQALQAAQAWGDPEAPAFPNLGQDGSVLTTGGTDDQDGTEGSDSGDEGGAPPGGHPGGGGSSGDGGSSDGGDGPGGGAPAPGKDQDQPIDPRDIEKAAQFLKEGEKEGAKAFAIQMAEEMRAEGRSTASVADIARRILAAAVDFYRADREAAEAANELPAQIWNDPEMMRIGMDFSQAYARGDADGARQAVARGLLLAQQIADEAGMMEQIDADRILNNFLPDREDRDIDGPEADLRQDLGRIDAAVRNHRQRQAAAAEEQRTPPPSDATSGTGQDYAPSVSDIADYDLTDQINAQLGLILRDLINEDPQSARARAVELERMLVGVMGPFGNMKAADILKRVLRKKKEIDAKNGTAKPAPDPIRVASDDRTDDAQSDSGDTSDSETDSETDSAYSGTDTVDIKRDDRDDDDDRPPAAGVAIAVNIVPKVNWKKFCDIYSISADEIATLMEIGTKIAKKGDDASAVLKLCKEFFKRAKKAKTGSKFKSAIHVGAAVEDALLRKQNGEMLAKALKPSDLDGEDDELAA